MDGLSQIYNAKAAYLERQALLRHDFQEAAREQARLMGWLGQGIMWLGSRFILWGKALQNRRQPTHFQPS